MSRPNSGRYGVNKPTPITSKPYLEDMRRDGRHWYYTNDIAVIRADVDVVDGWSGDIRNIVDVEGGHMRVEVWMAKGHEILATLFTFQVLTLPRYVYRYEVENHHIEWQSGICNESYYPRQLSRVLRRLKVRPWEAEYDVGILGYPIEGSLSHNGWELDVSADQFGVLRGPREDPEKLLSAAELYLHALAGNDVAIPWLGLRKETRSLPRGLWDMSDPVYVRTTIDPTTRKDPNEKSWDKGLLMFGENYGQHFSRFCDKLEADNKWSGLFRMWCGLRREHRLRPAVRETHRLLDEGKKIGLEVEPPNIPAATKEFAERVCSREQKRGRYCDPSTWRGVLRILRNETEHQVFWSREPDAVRAVQQFSAGVADVVGEALWKQVVEK